MVQKYTISLLEIMHTPPVNKVSTLIYHKGLVGLCSTVIF